MHYLRAQLWHLKNMTGASDEDLDEALWEEDQKGPKKKKEQKESTPSVVDEFVNDWVPGARMGNLADQEYSQGNVAMGTVYFLGGVVEAGVESVSWVMGGALAAKFLPKLGQYLAGRFATKTGTTVLGKYPDYVNLASELNARRFNIPTDIWNKMTSAEQWTANVKFLDRTIARGDKIILSNPVKDIVKLVDTSAGT